MEVKEAMQIILNVVENGTSCGRLTEKVRKAKIILSNYVYKKLAEDEENNE